MNLLSLFLSGCYRTSQRASVVGWLEPSLLGGRMTSLSRPARRDLFGKRTEVLKTEVSYEINEQFTRIANEIGLSKSEMLREMVMVRVLGVDEVCRLHGERVVLASGIGTESEQKSTGECAP